MSNAALTRAISRLFDQERFYAELILSMDRIITKRVPTAGVCIKSNIELLVNPDYFAGLSDKEQIALLIHECDHILFDHIPRMKEAMPDVYGKSKDALDGLINQTKHKVANISADCAINPGVPNIPQGAMLPKMFDLPDGQLMEWYLHNLKDNDKVKQMTQFDDHSIWGESEGEKEELREKLRQSINKAGQRAKAAGKLTSEQELLIDKLNYKARDWKSDLKRFAARAMEVLLETSKKKRNRRYGIMYPGTVKEERLHIGVAIDTSGSISDEQLNQFMAEVGNIAKHAIVTVVEADSEVKNSYLYDPKKQYKVAGRGGTAYQPAFDYFTKETDVDGVIYFGDMDCFDEELVKPKYPVLWAIVGNQEPPAKWGSQTKVEVRNK